MFLGCSWNEFGMISEMLLGFTWNVFEMILGPFWDGFGNLFDVFGMFGNAFDMFGMLLE